MPKQFWRDMRGVHAADCACDTCRERNALYDACTCEPRHTRDAASWFRHQPDQLAAHSCASCPSHDPERR